MRPLLLNATELDRFRSIVEFFLGLRFDDVRPEQLELVLRRRLAATQQTCQAYLQGIAQDPDDELAALASELTVGETYFLRHIEQFRALTETVVPERLRANGERAPVRILSAACASGEEAYSLAIALRESGVAASRTSIIGVDVNPIALRKARLGRYTPWSLRAVPLAIQRRWFTIAEDGALIEPTIRDSVTFERRNLAQPHSELWQPETFDVVFCRNVLMYFTTEVMIDVVARISRALVPGGYLFLGSAETLRDLSTDFTLLESHGTFYYQRKGAAPHQVHPRPALSHRMAEAVAQPEVATPRPDSRTPSAGGETPQDDQGPDLGRALELLRQERFAEALVSVDAVTAASERTGDPEGTPEVMLLRAALLTHCGSLPAAELICRTLLTIDQRNAGAHVLLALCNEVENELQGALEHCRKAITYDPGFAMPHVQLGRLARRRGDLKTARREFAESARLLPSETDRRILLFGGGFDRAALVSLCRTQSVEGRQDL